MEKIQGGERMKWIVVRESKSGVSKQHFVIESNSPEEALKKVVDFTEEIMYYKFSVYNFIKL